MSNLINKVSIIVVTFIVICISLLCSSDNVEDTKRLPFCGEPKPVKEKSLVLVSTLDGYVSALNLQDGGTETWSTPTEPGPLLSSSIHRLELTNSGNWVRMIPSLSGGLYKFNGENLEPIPVTADNLLEASFRYSEDVVISGGKESRSYGLDMETGKILYECSMNNCGNITPSVTHSSDMIIIQRLTQTVRAIEPRSGNERWNFSVGQHDLKILPDENSDCHHTSQPIAQVNLKVIVPEGLLCAMSKDEPNKVLWQHKFKSPIVNAWRLDNGRVEIVDLFGSSQVGEDIPDSPDVYVGMHNKQLYIQESVAMQKKLQASSIRHHQHLLTDESKFPRIPWHPIPATSLLGLTHEREERDITSLSQRKDVTATTALSVLYASEYVNGNGYYLYSTDIRKDPTKGGQCDEPSSDLNLSITALEEEEDKEDDDDPYGGLPVQIININMSFWYWWKEVLITSLLMAVLVNLLINKRLYKCFQKYFKARQVKELIVSVEEKQWDCSDFIEIVRKFSESSQDSNQEYVSRYLTDFEPIHCLGKGGFGVVFQAKNKIDDCDYAIKRISLPNRQDSRDRVMREVKALAKLDNQHIVRYFNAWLEFPPKGWQEEQDKTWKNKERDDFLSSLDEHTSGDLSASKILPAPVTHSKPLKLKNSSIFSRKFITSSKLFKHLSSSLRYRQVASETNENSDSVVFQHSQNETDSDTSLITDKKKNDVLSQDDSFIQFEGSHEDNQDNDSPETLLKSSIIDISSSPEKSRVISQRKRPKSLSICPEAVVSPSRLYLYIQMQLCRKNSLREWLSENVSFRDKTEIVNIFEQIVHAVEYVHMQGLIHRDLKPSNIFFSLEGQIKVGDFGLVTAMSEGDVSPLISSKTGLVDERHTAKVGTQLYMSPEQMAGKAYNYKVDIYSLGMIFFELLIPFHTQMERWKMLSNLRNNLYPNQFESKYPQELELLKSMLATSPEQRVTTYGIRAKPPLLDLHPENNIDARWHYELPRGHIRTPSFSKSQSSSSGSSAD